MFKRVFSLSLVAISYLSAELVKTGVTEVVYSGDDGTYQRGVSRSYTRDDGLSVVVDNATGLMWQDNSEAKTVKKDWQGAIDYFIK